VASSVAIPLALLFLDVAGYVSNAARQPTKVLWVIRILVGPIPALMLCAGIAFAILYPLNRERYAQVCQALESRRVRKEVV
jgi:GPH family glycoside/pentoside/hexuronide:cation symporter